MPIFEYISHWLEKYLSYGMLSQLFSGMRVTAAIFALTLLFSLPLGLLISFGRMSRFPPLKWAARIFISIMRGTPLMLQLMLIYFGPFYIFGIKLSDSYRFYAVIIGFSLNYSAYFAEIYRAGIDSIPAGQYEAASVLGFTRAQTFLRIVLPQVVKRIMPPVTNETITLVKDTSLAYVISVFEMLAAARKMVAVGDVSVVPFIVVGVFYYIMNYVVAMIMELIEKKLDYYR